MGMEAEAEAVLGKARRLDPGDPRLASKSPEPPSAVYEIGAVSEMPEFPEMELPMQEEHAQPEAKIFELDEPLDEEISLPAEKAVESDVQPEPDVQSELDVKPEDVPFPEQEEKYLFATENQLELEHLAGPSMTPGSVHYLEERAEADFYAQQGLTQEAVDIYRELLSVNPDDHEVHARYETLLDSLRKEPEPQDIELVAEEPEAIRSLSIRAGALFQAIR